MEEFEETEESIVIETSEIIKPHNDQPEEVVIILPDESCFDYDSSKKRMDGSKITWTKEQTHMLIEEYKTYKQELENPSSTKLAVWDKIAEKINEKWNSNFSADTCATKWRSMKNTYKRIRFSQRSEVSKKRWEFYIPLNEVYKGVKLDKPSPRILGGLGDNEQQIHIVQFNPQDPNQNIQSFELPARSATPEPSHYEMDFSEPPMWFREFIQEYHKSEDLKMKMLQQIHKDIVRVGEKQCSLLEKLLAQNKK